jgi:hypothetical protein
MVSKFKKNKKNSVDLEVLNIIKEPLKTGLQTLLLHHQYGAVQPFIYQPFFFTKYMKCFRRFFNRQK